MIKSIAVEDLLPETKARLKIGDTEISHRLVVLGKILLSLEGLTKRDALWVLRTAVNHLKGYREKNKRA